MHIDGNVFVIAVRLFIARQSHSNIRVNLAESLLALNAVSVLGDMLKELLSLVLQMKPSKGIIQAECVEYITIKAAVCGDLKFAFKKSILCLAVSIISMKP